MNTAEKIKVLVVDDHPLIRLGVSAMINAQHDTEVVAQAGNGKDAIELFRGHQPDVTLMDLRMPGMSGVETIRAIRASNPRARFVVLTSYEGDEDIHQALAAGALGYLVKGMPHEALMEAVRRVNAGFRFLPPPVVRSLAGRLPNSELSAREKEVLLLIARGKSNREIADLLGITEATVKCHVSVILKRLDANDRTHAAILALERGIIHLVINKF